MPRARSGAKRPPCRAIGWKWRGLADSVFGFGNTASERIPAAVRRSAAVLASNTLQCVRSSTLSVR